MREFEYVCKTCGGIFTTHDIGQPICRGCWGEKGWSRPLLFEMFGYPNPSPRFAPKLGNKIAWKERIKKQNETLRRLILDKK